MQCIHHVTRGFWTWDSYIAGTYAWNMKVAACCCVVEISRDASLGVHGSCNGGQGPQGRWQRRGDGAQSLVPWCNLVGFVVLKVFYFWFLFDWIIFGFYFCALVDWSSAQGRGLSLQSCPKSRPALPLGSEVALSSEVTWFNQYIFIFLGVVFCAVLNSEFWIPWFMIWGAPITCTSSSMEPAPASISRFLWNLDCIQLVFLFIVDSLFLQRIKNGSFKISHTKDRCVLPRLKKTAEIEIELNQHFSTFFLCCWNWFGFLQVGTLFALFLCSKIIDLRNLQIDLWWQKRFLIYSKMMMMMRQQKTRRELRKIFVTI